MNWDVSNYEDNYFDRIQVPVLFHNFYERQLNIDWHKAFIDNGVVITMQPDLLFVNATSLDKYYIIKANAVKRFGSKRRWIRGTNY